MQSRLLLAVQNSIGAAKQRTVSNSDVIDKVKVIIVLKQPQIFTTNQRCSLHSSLELSHKSCLPQLLEEMREDCDGRHSIELLDENCGEDEDDLHKILALSNPFRRIDG